MTYVPATDKLTLSVNSDEPAGGLFAHLANLPGLPPVRLAFNGAGPLDNFTAKLDFAAGPDVWANGDVVVARQGAGAAADPRPQFTARRHDAADHPPGLRRRDDAQGRRSASTTIRASPPRACISSRPTPGSTSKAASRRTTSSESGSTPARFRARRRSASSTSTPRSSGRFRARQSKAPSTPGDIHVAEGSLDHVAATFHAAPNGAADG